MEVLFERRHNDGLWEGYTSNYIKVHVKSDENLENEIKTVKITRALAEQAEGETVKLVN